MITFKKSGNFTKVTGYLERLKECFNVGILNKYGQMGVDVLASSTPKDSGRTANSWFYKIENKNGRASISFHNSNIQNGVPIAIIIQYGHATGTGGYVQGKDYINPAIRPVFEQLADEVWKEVSKV